MIAKISNISSFQAALKYVVNKEKVTEFEGVEMKEAAATRIGGNLMTSKVSTMSNEFNSIPNNLKHPGKHLSISLPIGETVDDATWLEIAKQAISTNYKEDGRNDYSKCQWVAYRHNDTEHQHIHVIINRKNFEGKTVLDRNEKWHYMDVMRELEIKHELTELPKKAKNNVKESIFESKINKVGANTDKRIVAKKIDLAVENASNMEEFKKILHVSGIEWQPRINDETGETTGARYYYEQGKKGRGVTFSGSKVGYSLPRVQEIFLEKEQAVEHNLKKAPVKKLTRTEFVAMIKESNDIDKLKRVLEAKPKEERQALYDEFLKQKAKNKEQANALVPLFKSYGIPEPRKEEVKKAPSTPEAPKPTVNRRENKNEEHRHITDKINDMLDSPRGKNDLKNYLKTLDKQTVSELDPQMGKTAIKRTQMKKALDEAMGKGKSRGMGI